MHREDCDCRPCMGERYLVLFVSPHWTKVRHEIAARAKENA